MLGGTRAARCGVVGRRDADGPHNRHVPGNRGSVEAGDLGGGDFGDGLANELRCAAPTGAKNEGDVVRLDARALADDGCGLLGEREGVVLVMHRGAPAARQRGSRRAVMQRAARNR